MSATIVQRNGCEWLDVDLYPSGRTQIVNPHAKMITLKWVKSTGTKPHYTVSVWQLPGGAMVVNRETFQDLMRLFP